MKKKSYHLRVTDEDQARVAAVVERENAIRKARATLAPLPTVTEQSVALICFRLGLARFEEVERLKREAHARARKPTSES